MTSCYYSVLGQNRLNIFLGSQISYQYWLQWMWIDLANNRHYVVRQNIINLPRFISRLWRRSEGYWRQERRGSTGGDMSQWWWWLQLGINWYNSSKRSKSPWHSGTQRDRTIQQLLMFLVHSCLLTVCTPDPPISSQHSSGQKSFLSAEIPTAPMSD